MSGVGQVDAHLQENGAGPLAGPAPFERPEVWIGAAFLAGFLVAFAWKRRRRG